MVPINALGWSWPTIRFFLNMKATTKKDKARVSFSYFLEKRTSPPAEMENFWPFRNKKSGT